MDSEYQSTSERRIVGDRRSGADNRTEVDKQMMGERRSSLARRSETEGGQAVVRPSDEVLALFVRRLRRALTSQTGQPFFGVLRGESDFSTYPDVLRTLAWLESLAGENKVAK